MADDNDDSWLYGGGPDDASQHEDKQDEESEDLAPVKNGNTENKTFETFDEHNFEEAGDEHLLAEESKDGEDEEKKSQGGDSDDSDDDDDINVVIGDIKAGGTSYNVKNQQDKQKLPGSKFNIEEFESVGSINGQPAFEFAIENIEDKPWRKPGADITDYFNYGFNEETWRAYCERQKKMRIHESGVGLAGLTAAQNPQGMMEPRPGINIGIKRIGGPRPKTSGIDVIGAPSQNPIRPPAPRENVIQVMTADRREYSRTVVGNPPPNPQIPIQFNVPPEEFYNHEEQDAFNYGYEPTQDSQWEPQNQGWAPSEIKELTGGINQPPPMMGLNIPPPIMGGGMPRMPMMQQPPGMGIPPLMGQMTSMPQSLKPSDSRDRRERDSRHYDETRKRGRERSLSRERERKERERPPREDRSKHDRDQARDSRYRETSSRRETRRSKSREKSKRSKSRDKPRRSRSKERKVDDKEKDRTRSDKSKRSKKEDS